MLNCRIEENVNPIRIICDTNLEIPLDCNIVKTANEVKTIIAYSNDVNIEKIKKLEMCNIKLLKIPVYNEAKGIDLNILMEKLGELRIDSVLIEGGESIITSAIEDGIVNKIYAYIAPKIIGGRYALSPIAGKGIENMSDAIKLKDVQISQIGGDVMISGNIKILY